MKNRTNSSLLSNHPGAKQLLAWQGIESSLSPKHLPSLMSLSFFYTLQYGLCTWYQQGRAYVPVISQSGSLYLVSARQGLCTVPGISQAGSVYLLSARQGLCTWYQLGRAYVHCTVPGISQAGAMYLVSAGSMYLVSARQGLCIPGISQEGLCTWYQLGRV